MSMGKPNCKTCGAALTPVITWVHENSPASRHTAAPEGKTVIEFPESEYEGEARILQLVR